LFQNLALNSRQWNNTLFSLCLVCYSGKHWNKIQQEDWLSQKGPRQRFQTPRSKTRGSRSWYQMKGLAGMYRHVKYESPSTNQSKVITKVKVCWRTDNHYFRAPTISGALKLWMCNSINKHEHFSWRDFLLTM
jgi:hypothetical protein